jgi:hypothetical protein
MDKEMEKGGHCFVRYADNFSIFVNNQSVGGRVKESISTYLTTKLKLNNPSFANHFQFTGMVIFFRLLG